MAFSTLPMFWGLQMALVVSVARGSKDDAEKLAPMP
jgi:hypothetical protein